MPKENLILDYSSPPTVVKFPTPIRLIVLLFILPALVLPFVEYAVSIVSPLTAATEFFHRVVLRWTAQIFLAMLGLPFFVGIPLVLCHLRLLIFGELSKMERWTGFVVAVLGMAPVVAIISYVAIQLFFDHTGHWTKQEILAIGILVVPAVVIAFGVCVVWLLGKHVSHGTRICACLCITYAMGLIFCAVLIGIYDPKHLSFGYWLSLPVIVGCLIDLTTLAVMAFRRPQS
ncbi:MAG: hypothetical protein FWD61_16340 [Phycisphaerales bacterium]|nr:hypothetical protein [Phycisphaerales bacterium]